MHTKKEPPKICRSCRTRKEPLSCSACGIPLNPKSALKTKLCWTCQLKSHSKQFKERGKDDKFGNWLSGFVDGEANFNGNGKHGFCFRIILREDDKEILETIREYLGVGELYYRDVKKSMDNWNPKYVSEVRRNQWVYIVQPVMDLINVVIPHFEEYPLRAKKKYQYEKWRDCLINTKSYKSLKKEVV
jgi:hypothetical protein